LDYRRRVHALYARLRSSDAALEERSAEFRRGRDELFRAHAQSALTAPQRSDFTGLPHHPYDPAWRFVLPVETNVEPDIIEVSLRDDGRTRMQRFGRVRFSVEGREVSLSLFWILGYGGGLFLPFGDVTNRTTTFGGGRYVLDTIKHADLGHEGGCLVVDFNYAYNPSCAYNEQWNCPLPPDENRLPVAIPAGEQRYPG
jgi:uncharacterized protein (DUF1684 family)